MQWPFPPLRIVECIAAASLLAIGMSTAMARDISCTGPMIDVDLDPRMAFPYAAIYDPDHNRTCMLDRGPAGHDPLRGICNPGETCSISGPYKRNVRETYFLDLMDRRVTVKRPERGEAPSGK
jgi:hypothetical protein